MTIKLVTLKSGEDVIADITEMRSDDHVFGYHFKNPCVVKLYSEKLPEGSGRSPMKIQLIPYQPLAKEQTIPIVADWVISIMEPIDRLVEIYKNGLKDEDRESKTVGIGQDDPTDAD